MTDENMKPEAPKKNSYLTIGNILLGLLAIGGYLQAIKYTPVAEIWLLLIIIASLPILIRKIKKQSPWEGKYPLGWIFLSIFFALSFYSGFMSGLSSTSTQEKTQQEEKQTITSRKIGESFQVGYTRYKINRFQWKSRIGNAYFGQDANARYLLVYVQVKNEDTEQRMIPEFQLIDEEGSSYEESSDKMFLDKNTFLENLNPGVQKNAVLLFDVPPNNHYHLLVSGGFWSADSALVKLN